MKSKFKTYGPFIFGKGFIPFDLPEGFQWIESANDWLMAKDKDDNLYLATKEKIYPAKRSENGIQLIREI